MSRKFLHIILCGLYCLVFSHSESKADCAQITLYPDTWGGALGPWFSMYYISCKDQKQKLLRQGYTGNDALKADDAEVGTHITIGHMGTNEDWYPKQLVPQGSIVFTCTNVPAECYLGAPQMTHKPSTNQQFNSKKPGVQSKSQEEATAQGKTHRGGVIQAK